MSAEAGPRLVAVRRQDGSTVAAKAEVGDGLRTRFMGLMGRSQLDPDEGLWLTPCKSIHMFFMRSAIDAVFLDQEHQVVRTISRMRPWSMMVRPAWAARSCLELAPGTIERLGLSAGEALSLTTVPVLTKSGSAQLQP